jgi:hypothetical protein
MSRPISSILRNPDAVRAAVARSSSIKEALGILGLRAAGGNYRAFREACARSGVDVPNWTHGPPRTGDFIRSIPDAQVFCEGSAYTQSKQIKRRLIEGGLPECCALCGLGPTWNGKPLVLHLDHINGVHDDNRRDNLRLLCPNCDSQTETYAGRNGRERRTPCRWCSHLNKLGSSRCGGCLRWFVQRAEWHPSKISWPDGETLAIMLRDKPAVAVAKALGVSPRAISKHMAHVRG